MPDRCLQSAYGLVESASPRWSESVTGIDDEGVTGSISNNTKIAYLEERQIFFGCTGKEKKIQEGSTRREMDAKGKDTNEIKCESIERISKNGSAQN